MPSAPACRAVVLSLLLLGLAILLPLAVGRAQRTIPGREDQLADTLYLQWARELPTPRPAWPDQPMMAFDAAPRPAVLGDTVFVPCSATDRMTAYDAATGEEKWHFTTDGPVRFAPAVWHDRIFAVSDDGYLYCLAAADGQLLWKFRGGPSERKVLGNDRLVSTWPARGAPAVADGKVYFAAGIWPFMGIFLHALDARTGAVVWSNDGDGSIYIKQPHQADSFAGVAPQGTLVVAGERLLVPGGRSVPACYDRTTGKLLHFRLADNSKRGGGSEVVVAGAVFLNGGGAFDLAIGTYLGTVGNPALLAGDMLYACAGDELRAFDLQHVAVKLEEVLDIKKQKTTRGSWNPVKIGAVRVAGIEALTRAGSRLYAGTPGKVLAIETPLRGADTRVCWRAKVKGRPAHLVAAGGRLYVSTREGWLYCFGPEQRDPVTHLLPAAPAPPHDGWSDAAADILTTTGVREGYCVAWGAGSGRLIHELARQSELRVIAVEPDVEKADVVRQRLMAAGLHGERVHVVVADPDTVELPPYLASLMVSEDLMAAGINDVAAFVRRAYTSLQPFGGVACLPLPDNYADEFRAVATNLPQAKLHEAGRWKLLTREGPLPGSADWTHEHADAANTRVSRDKLVKAPLGLLWFGGPSHKGVLPRHGHGPQPQVLSGRLFIEGVDMLRAVDVYTGRLLWEARLPGVGKAYDYLAHQPGANAGGSNFVSTPDGIYVAYGSKCVRLDPATGQRLAEIRLPAMPKARGLLTWDYINVSEDYLVAGANPPPAERGRPVAISSSQYLIVMNRQTGQVLWTATAKNGFRHNAVCLGGGRLYAIDRPSADFLTRLFRRDRGSGPARLLAFDLCSGQELWSTTADVFGTWLSYTAKHDILVEAGRVARDTLRDEPKGMRAYQAGDGKVLWYRKDYAGPAMIHGDVILKDQSACDLRTGEPLMRDDPLTGEKVEWKWVRTYGCNTPMASEHLLTFRSGAAGYFDLCGDGGTGNFGGFRSGCTNNLVVAGGVLSAPDYTRTCTCSYQNQASLALVPLPDGEQWTYFGSSEVKGPVRRVGINLGAPGNRKAKDGTLWLEYPVVGGPSPRVPVAVYPASVTWFRRHESQVGGDGLPWVNASGAEGVRSVVVTLAKEARTQRTYTVRLYFAEPARLGLGERVFDVALQGKTVLSAFDISREAGGPGRGVVREFHGVAVVKELTVTLTPSAGPGPVLCGIEAVAEGW